MVQFRWIKTSLFVILVLLFTAVTGQPSFMARVGDEVTLPCENVIKNQRRCDGTSWAASRYNGASAKQLVNLGQISRTGIRESISDRLSVTATCSLVVKNVTVDDVGRYTCRQYKSDKQQGQDAQVLLSVINIVHENKMAPLICSVLVYESCDYTVQWLYEGNEGDARSEVFACSARVTFLTPNYNQKSNYYERLKCNVTDNKSGEMLLCGASRQSCEKTAKGNTSAEGGTATHEDDTTKQDWWMFVIVAVGVVALIIVIAAVIRWKITKGNKTQKDEKLGKSLNPAATQSASETSQDMAELENGISYASISFTKKTDSKGQVHDEGGYDEDRKTGASDDTSCVYATINKANRKDVAV